jgi:hypothetical protein
MGLPLASSGSHRDAARCSAMPRDPLGALTCTAPRSPPSGMLREAASPPFGPRAVARRTLRVCTRGRDGLRCAAGAGVAELEADRQHFG